MADFNSKYSGEQVEALLDQVASGNAGGGGGGGITVETDPIFSASPAAAITEEKIAEWDAKSAQGEKGDKGDTGPKGEDGADGVGVQSVAQTTTSNVDGGSNVVTVTLTDGTKSTFTVKNGSKGSQGIQGEQGPKGDTGATGAKGDKGDTGAAGTNGTNGKDGADGATFTPSVDSAGNLSWSNNKGLTNPPTVNIKGPKGDKGDAGEGGGGSSGGGSGGPMIVEIDTTDYNFVDLADNTIYLFYGQLSNLEVMPSMQLTKGCLLRFETASDCTLIIPDCYWANGAIPSIAGNTYYELSLTDSQDGYILAVITPFKPA